MKRGFTLIELLVAVAIIGLLATLSVVSFSSSREKARMASGQLTSRTIFDALADEAIGVWSFDECEGFTTYDMSGQRNDGNIITAAQGKWTKQTPFNQGCALVFDGLWDYIETDYTWMTRPNSFTATAWFKTSSTDVGYILSNGTVHPIAVDPSGVLQICPGIDECANGTKKVNDNKWHFIAVTGDSTSVRAYLDGSRKVEAIVQPVPSSTTGPMHIGHCSLGGYNFLGLIDEVRVYQRALTSEEIQQLYAQDLMRMSIAKQ